MSLNILSSKIQSLRDEAQTVINAANEAIRAIRESDRLTGAAARRDIAATYLAKSAKLAALLATERKITEEEREALERSLFGTTTTDPSAIIAYRDAQDRASALTVKDSDKAEEIAHSARRSGDTTLAAAILNRALAFPSDRGWNQVVSSFMNADPVRSETLKDLKDIHRWVTEQDSGFNGYFGTYYLAEPTEFRGLDAAAIRRVAEGKGEPAQVYGNGHQW